MPSLFDSPSPFSLNPYHSLHFIHHHCSHLFHMSSLYPLTLFISPHAPSLFHITPYFISPIPPFYSTSALPFISCHLFFISYQSLPFIHLSCVNSSFRSSLGASQIIGPQIVSEKKNHTVHHEYAAVTTQMFINDEMPEKFEQSQIFELCGCYPLYEQFLSLNRIHSSL
jgi:hypothetical protein